MRWSCTTSARRGTLSRISVSLVSRPAIISGRAAFFAPEIGIAPLSLLPPTMRMRSIFVVPEIRFRRLCRMTTDLGPPGPQCKACPAGKWRFYRQGLKAALTAQDRRRCPGLSAGFPSASGESAAPRSRACSFRRLRLSRSAFARRAFLPSAGDFPLWSEDFVMIGRPDKKGCVASLHPAGPCGKDRAVSGPYFKASRQNSSAGFAAVAQW